MAPETVLLTSHDELKQAAKLIDKVRASLDDSQKFFLLPKTVEFMKNQLTDGNAILGLKDANGTLMGLTIIRKMDHWTDIPNFEGLPFIGFLANETPCMLQSVCTHPEYRGAGLADKLLTAAENWCRENGRTRLIARIVTENSGSRNAFTRNEFQILSEGIDAQDGYGYLYAGKAIVSNPYLVGEEDYLTIGDHPTESDIHPC